MTRRLSFPVLITALGLAAATLPALAATLIPEPVAAQHGLTRAWAAQGRARIAAQFDLGTHVARVQDLYQRLADRR